MRYRLAALLLVLLCAAWARASELELVTNGEFEDGITAWEQTISGEYMYFQHATNLDHDADYEVRCYSNDGHGISRLRQKVALPDLSAVLSATLKTSAIGGGGAWCVSGLIVGYLDEMGSLLGQTALAAISADCPWVDTPTMHIIDAAGDWATHSFTIGDELANLSGVDPSAVRELDIAILVSASNC